MRVILPSVADTDRLGAALAATRPRPAVVALSGPLGAGKSSLARAMLRAMGVTGAVRSPTYTLVERYALPDGEALHLDLYRIGAPEELDYLGLDDAAQAQLWLIEWPERGLGALPPLDLRIDLEMEDGGRVAELVSTSVAGSDWLVRLAASTIS
ncbi:MAG: tRNA (adenosine(37)-N6)-threonylcarbamoyltransferase complex ATPase subunit type 1 TsaE [Xanthomonadaceae bacterium]|nr:tRNA (adenosine(37)-N6)-threonylcarbamoyltransferase complex ATPase subunit type 1 TsaE [Xanthomonadaceae bacterium]